MLNEKQIRMEVGEILDTYCKECFLQAYFRKEYGKKKAQTFCIKQCTVGQKLKMYGDQLSK